MRSRELKQAVGAMLAAVPPAVRNSIECSERDVAGVRRYTWTKRSSGSLRYIQITPLPEDESAVPWEYAVLMGAWDSADPEDDGDGRNGGSLKYVVRLVQLWLVDCVPWSSLPDPE